MLYLIRPNTRLAWNDLPTNTVLEVANARGADLADLTWEPSDRELTWDIVRLALRHGIACSTGIVLPGIVLYEEQKAQELRSIHADLVEARAKAYTPQLEAFLEALTPGWTESGRELDERVDESNARSVREAEEVRSRLLASEPKEALVTHWRSLGGIEPDPV
ncbi:hypothetical protein [Curtobacterium flaccumfaciens]|uniref:hypothetical protein n=1 Tax=Curtobacterium flaccumfaciens TaxID=2035 RepID=UPI0039945D73